jgi:hypothetical protein
MKSLRIANDQLLAIAMCVYSAFYDCVESRKENLLYICLLLRSYDMTALRHQALNICSLL